MTPGASRPLPAHMPRDAAVNTPRNALRTPATACQALVPDAPAASRRHVQLGTEAATAGSTGVAVTGSANSQSPLPGG
ncbi:hypothetical protein ACWCQN_41880 [Streptomyces sp. NPDC001984]